MRLAFSAAVERVARHVASKTSAGSTDYPKIIREALHDLTPAMRLELATCNEMTLQNALHNALTHLRSST